MKLNRRSFMKLIPLGIVAIGLWWLIEENAREPIRIPQVTGTISTTSNSSNIASTTEITLQPTLATSTLTQATSTPTVFEFPTTWNGELAKTINPNDYRLKIEGDIPNPLELKLEDLYDMPGVQKTLRISCVEGWSADVPWEGIPLSYLLQQAGSSPRNITHVTIKGVTGYSTTLNSDEVANSDFMIALKVNGAQLTVDHGFPARLVAPTRLGLDWVKQVVTITCTSN
jgi:DMSO/TMAO reductase YedYZ molybdopterin-dependent catalytic subunit